MEHVKLLHKDENKVVEDTYKLTPICSRTCSIVIGFFTNSTRILKVIFILAISFMTYKAYEWHIERNQPVIIVVTPTYKRLERIADMIRLSQTLMHVKNLDWIVVEDANYTVKAVERLLNRSHIPYVYLNTTTEKGFKSKLKLFDKIFMFAMILRWISLIKIIFRKRMDTEKFGVGLY